MIHDILLDCSNHAATGSAGFDSPSIVSRGNSQLTRSATFVFDVLVFMCVSLCRNITNFSYPASTPSPSYVGFSTATAVASIISFPGLNADKSIKSPSSPASSPPSARTFLCFCAPLTGRERLLYLRE